MVASNSLAFVLTVFNCLASWRPEGMHRIQKGAVTSCPGHGLSFPPAVVCFPVWARLACWQSGWEPGGRTFWGHWRLGMPWGWWNEEAFELGWDADRASRVATTVGGSWDLITALNPLFWGWGLMWCWSLLWTLSAWGVLCALWAPAVVLCWGLSQPNLQTE